MGLFGEEVVEVKNYLEVPHPILHKLIRKESDEDYEFVERIDGYHGCGFSLTFAIFRHKGKLYRFAELEYTDLFTYSIPYEVFGKKQVREYTSYTNYVKKEEE